MRNNDIIVGAKSARSVAVYYKRVESLFQTMSTYPTEKEVVNHTKGLKRLS